MKLATWNLQHGRSHPAHRMQREVLAELAADVTVLTEPAPGYVDGPGVVVSPPGPDGGLPWIAIVGATVEPVALLPYERLAVAARVGAGTATVIVYGTVLPWASVNTHVRSLPRPGERSVDVFRRVLAEQISDIRAIRNRFHLPIFWIGDFNCALVGSTRAGSREKRALLLDALARLDLTACNKDDDHAVAGLSTIDLICGPSAWRYPARGRIDPVRGGVTMSDHAGYWVEVERGKRREF